MAGNIKGIILAGGHGTRLYPLTLGVSKQLLPVYDKPMIYYPLSILMQNDIREVLIITNTGNEAIYHSVLGDGSQLGINIKYHGQSKPRGIADAFILGENFIGDDDVCLILGDNLFFGDPLSFRVNVDSFAKIFAYKVSNPSSYGVYVPGDESESKIIEKPVNFISPWAVTGLYKYPPDVVDIAKSLEPSPRGELEITDINQIYLKKAKMIVKKLPKGTVWLDTGSHEALADATAMIRTIEARQCSKVACLEEIAFNKGWISEATLTAQADRYPSGYGTYLKNLCKRN